MRILFCGHLQDVTGCAEMELPPDPVDADGLWQKIIAVHPGLKPLRDSVRLARNHEFAGPETLFGGSDEVAMIPPVSGG